jgi:hypothetical protein
LGHASVNDTPDGWSGDLSGQLIGVDLGRLARENAASALTGTADITIEKARFQRGRIDELTGRIVSGPGVLGGRMLAALVTYLRLTPSPQLAVAGESLAFDRFGLDFRIDSRGIRIAGLQGAVAVAGGRAILTEPSSQPQPIITLIQALAPVNEGGLARLLPVYDVGKVY